MITFKQYLSPPPAALDIFSITKYSISIVVTEDKLTFKGTIKIELEGEWYVATCLENFIASQGKTIDEALANLREAIALYYGEH